MGGLENDNVIIFILQVRNSDQGPFDVENIFGDVWVFCQKFLVILPFMPDFSDNIGGEGYLDFDFGKCLLYGVLDVGDGHQG